MKKSKKQLFNRVSIIGVGLLGGSIGMAIRKRKLAAEVVGFFRKKNKIARAVKMGAIDKGYDDLRRTIGNSDFVILCTPVSDIIKKLKDKSNLFKKTTLVTDIGSTKLKICKAAGGLNFVGSHPLAGSEQSGIAFAQADLFVNSICILTPGPNTSRNAIHRVAEFWRSLGATVIILQAKKHDRILAFASHLPHIAAFSLIQSIPQKTLRFASGGLTDTTRIALSNPKIWVDIFSTNSKEVLAAIEIFERYIKRLKTAIAKRDEKKLLSILKQAQKKRSSVKLRP